MWRITSGAGGGADCEGQTNTADREELSGSLLLRSKMKGFEGCSHATRKRHPQAELIRIELAEAFRAVVAAPMLGARRSEHRCAQKHLSVESKLFLELKTKINQVRKERSKGTRK